MTAFNEQFLYGSARWAEPHELRPLYRGGSLFLALDERGKPLRHPGQGPTIVVAGSGAGKGATFLMYSALTCQRSALIVDPKGELAAVSLLAQTLIGKRAFCINPAGLLADLLPNHSTDPLDILQVGASTLVPDAKMISEMLVPFSGGGNSKHFEEMARLCLEALMLALVEKRGSGSLADLYRAVGMIEGDPDQWLSTLEMMGVSIYEHVRSAAGMMFFKLRDAPKEWSGIAGEMKKALSFLDDPSILHGLNNPSFSLSILCEQPSTVFINIPAEYFGIWNSYLRLLIGTAMLYRSRRPGGPRLAAFIDECGQLGHAEFLLRAVTFGRGMGLDVVTVWQDLGQIATHYKREGVQTFLGSSQVRMFFGVRDPETAELVSKMLGNETLSFDPELEQADARRNKAHIVRALMNGSDAIEAGLNFAQAARASINRKRIARPLLDPSEVLRMPEDRALLFVSGINCPPVAAYRVPYYLRRDLAGRWLPNPYHPPVGRVRVPGRFGTRLRRVILEPVPKKYEDWPQYQSGQWSFIEGYRPR